MKSYFGSIFVYLARSSKPSRSAPKSLLLHQQKAMDEATNVVTNMKVGTGKKTLV